MCSIHHVPFCICPHLSSALPFRREQLKPQCCAKSLFESYCSFKMIAESFIDDPLTFCRYWLTTLRHSPYINPAVIAHSFSYFYCQMVFLFFLVKISDFGPATILRIRKKKNWFTNYGRIFIKAYNIELYKKKKNQ